MRTLNRPSTNITPPTAAHPAAKHLGVRVARAVSRNVAPLRDMLAGPIEARRISVRDRYVLADLLAQHGLRLDLTDAGRNLAARL